ncbi:MAG: tripartite tricarboxylate transporter substrate binding protein [Defluviitaleaceae bacterium]|nr:tripartite tricarboxylate transporter substrate binding protein [Defluviitaleaceae bacterium]
MEQSKNRTKNKKMVLLLVIVFFGVFVGCGRQNTQEPTDGGFTAINNRVSDTNWPTRPVTIVVPFAPGGDTDFYARAYAPFLSEYFGVPFEVVNIPGDAGTYGASYVNSSTPDGYTMLFYHTGNMFTNVISGNTSLNWRDFAISNISNFDNATVLVAGTQFGFTDAADFLARARANPGGYRVATTMPGFSFFVLRKMELAGGFSLTPVSMAGAGLMAEAIINDEIELAIGVYAVFRPFIESGDLVPLLVSAERRNPNFRYVATVEDMGLAGAAMGRAYFFAFPPGTDDAILHRLSDVVADIQFNNEYIATIRDAFDARPFFLPTFAVDGFLQDIWDSMYQMSDYIEY